MTAAPRKTAVISRRPITMSAASTNRAARANTVKFDDGPASPSAGPMFDMALTTPEAAVTGSAEGDPVVSPGVMGVLVGVACPGSRILAQV